MDDQLSNRISRFLANRTSSRASERLGDYVVASSVGSVREENQDATLIVKARYHADAAERDFDLAVVCDGLGGMKQGAEASVLGLSAFAARLIRSSRASVEDRLLAGLREANAEIFKILRGSGGTTLSAVLNSHSGKSTICHVGDSRILFNWHRRAPPIELTMTRLELRLIKAVLLPTNHGIHVSCNLLGWGTI